MTTPQTQIEEILDYSDGLYMTMDFNWVITYSNKLSENLLNVPAKELIGSDLRETLPDVVSMFYKTLSKTLNHREPHNVISRYGPTQKILDLRTYPIESGLLAIFHDITSKEENRETMHDSETRYQAIREALSDALFSIDSNGLITSLNSAAEKMFGYSAEDIIGHNVSILMPEKERHAHEDYTAYSDLHEARIINQQRELHGVRKDGTEFPIELHVSPMNIAGEYGYVGVIRDITERKIAESKIIDEKIKAEKASKAKSEFMDSMSHEFHTPLNAILGYSQLLEMNSELETQYKEHVIEIHKAGKHLLDMVTDILNYTKIDSGKKDLHSQVVSLEELLVECLGLTSSLSREAKISLTVDPDCYRYLLQGDPVRLRQVFINLMSNAIKYNCENGKVSIDCKECGNNLLHITISDTGSGIDAARFDELFEPFNRLGKEGGPIQGTGIGLSITKQLVESMDGKIGVESTLGEGSQFWIELPLATLAG
jgi:PAS domain S-box-containing protein